MNKALAQLEFYLRVYKMGEWIEGTPPEEIIEHDKKIMDYEIAIKILKNNLKPIEDQSNKHI